MGKKKINHQFTAARHRILRSVFGKMTINFIKLHASKRMGAKSVKLSRRLHFCLFRVIVIFTPNKSNDYKKHSVFRFWSNIAVTKANSQKQKNKAITNYGEKKGGGG